MKHSHFSEVNSCLGGQEIYGLLCNPQIHSHVHKSQRKPHHTTIFFRIHFNISRVNFSLRLLQRKFCTHFLRPMHISCVSHLILLYNNIWRIVQLKRAAHYALVSILLMVEISSSAPCSPKHSVSADVVETDTISSETLDQAEKVYILVYCYII
jgi:hypothetical protein